MNSNSFPHRTFTAFLHAPSLDRKISWFRFYFGNFYLRMIFTKNITNIHIHIHIRKCSHCHKYKRNYSEEHHGYNEPRVVYVLTDIHNSYLWPDITHTTQTQERTNENEKNKKEKYSKQWCVCAMTPWPKTLNRKIFSMVYIRMQ